MLQHHLNMLFPESSVHISMDKRGNGRKVSVGGAGIWNKGCGVRTVLRVRKV
jgi:hypothetical protein